jgi:hypothetical protein
MMSTAALTGLLDVVSGLSCLVYGWPAPTASGLVYCGAEGIVAACAAPGMKAR